MSRRWELAVVLLLAAESTALAEPGPGAGPGPDARSGTRPRPEHDDVPSSEELRRFDEERSLAAEPVEVEPSKLPSPAGPVVLMCVGGTIAAIATPVVLGSLLMASLAGSMAEPGQRTAPDMTLPAEAGIAAGLGIAATIGGAVWLSDVNEQRQLARQHAVLGALPIPSYEPRTKSAALTFSGRF